MRFAGVILRSRRISPRRFVIPANVKEDFGTIAFPVEYAYTACNYLRSVATFTSSYGPKETQTNKSRDIECAPRPFKRSLEAR